MIGVTCRSTIFWWDFGSNLKTTSLYTSLISCSSPFFVFTLFSFPSLSSSFSLWPPSLPPSLLPCTLKPSAPLFLVPYFPLGAPYPMLLFCSFLLLFTLFPPLCLFACLHPFLSVPSVSSPLPPALLPSLPSVRVRAQGSEYSLAHVRGPWIVLSAGSDSPAWLGFSNELWKRRGKCRGWRCHIRGYPSSHLPFPPFPLVKAD